MTGPRPAAAKFPPDIPPQREDGGTRIITEDRRHKRIQRLLRQSRIPVEKSLANFNVKRPPHEVGLITKTLLESEFLDRWENVLAFGNPGSGKTHLLCAIGQELIARGRRVYFTTSALC